MAKRIGGDGGETERPLGEREHVHLSPSPADRLGQFRLERSSQG